MNAERGLLGKSKVKGLTLKTVEEIEKIRKRYFGLGYDCAHAAASVSRVFGRFIDYVQFDTPKRPAFIVLLDLPDEGLKNVHNGLAGETVKYIGKPFKNVMTHLLEDVGNCDGAIVVDREGKVVRVGAQLINLDTKKILKDRRREVLCDDNPTKILGFGNDVGTRHTSALVASYQHKGAKVITLSEETGDLRVYEKGRIIASTNSQDRIYGIKRKVLRKESALNRIVSMAAI
jgi:hypothetical protein